MKVTIEIDLPEGREMPKIEDILTLTSPDWHIEWWHYSDIQADHEWLTDDQAREVLALLNKHHDANIGVNWQMIDAVVDRYFPYPDEDEEE